MKISSVALGLSSLALAVGCTDDPGVLPGSGGGASVAGAGPTAGSGQVAGNGSGGGGILPVAGDSGVGGASGAAGSAPVGGAVVGGAAGAAGAQGTSGAAGSAGSAGSNAGGAGTGPSAGCGRMEPLNEPPRDYVQHDITVPVAAEYQPEYTSREYHTWLPDNYDPNKPYPLYFWGNGCGVSKGNPEGIPVANIAEVQTGAMLVFMIQEDGCFDAGKGGLANTPDVPYFETMLNDIEAKYCIDRSKIFVGGYSSTAWFAATLSCSHGNRINAIGMAAGGQQDELPMCTGPAGLILWAGNEGAGGNPIDTPAGVEWEGSAAVRDRLIAANGCSMTTTKWDSMWGSCNLYDGCGKNPVVFCPHGGGHDTGGGSQMNSQGFWKLFKQTW